MVIHEPHELKKIVRFNLLLSMAKLIEEKQPKKVVIRKIKKSTVTKYRVRIESQHRDFYYASDARQYARQLLGVDIYFLHLEKVEVEI